MPRLFRSLLAPCLVVLCVLALALPVAAHAEYRSSVPANGATVATPPAQVVVTFSQETSATQSKGQVTDATGSVVSSGPAVVDLNDRTKLTLPLKPNLPGGIYTVAYTSQSQDGHVVDGSFVFTVGPAARAGAAPWGTWLVVFAAASLVVLGGLFFVRRQARTLDAVAAGVSPNDEDRETEHN